MLLSALEYLVPKPLPFLRLGLANLPLILALDLLPIPAFGLLVLLKILGQALVTGSLFSYVFLFSAAGSAASACVMWLLNKAFPRAISCIGLSVAGAFASNAAQLAMARYYIFGETAWYIAPPFFAVGIVTGFLLGLFANKFVNESRWYAAVREAPNAFESIHTATSGNSDTAHSFAGPSNPGFRRFIVGILLVAVLLFVSNVVVRLAVTLISFVLVILDRRKIRFLPIVLTIVSIIAFNLAVPFGKVLWEGFGLTVTAGALEEGIKKALLMEGLLFISRWMLRYGLVLPGKLGSLVSDTLLLFTRLGQAKMKLNPRDIISGIDAIMNEPD